MSVFRYGVFGVMAFALVACGGKESHVVDTMQKKDKQLSCKEVLLEMNEAEFYKSMAEKNRGVNLANVLLPLGYISTYMSAEDAIEASNARIQYLDRIYQIMSCDLQKQSSMKTQVNAANDAVTADNAVYNPKAYNLFQKHPGEVGSW